jgi:hypothetical protein
MGSKCKVQVPERRQRTTILEFVGRARCRRCQALKDIDFGMKEALL